MITNLTLDPNQTIAFVSDVHLTPQNEALTQTFLNFLSEFVPTTDALFILGDLFDYWLGDDTLEQPEISPLTPVLKKFKALSQHLPIYIQHGNTDFLLGNNFAEYCGVQLIADPCRLSLGDQSFLLLHGDDACELDQAYLQTRSMRHQIIAPLLKLPFNLRLEKALAFRSYSAEVNRNKPKEHLYPPVETLERLLQTHQCQQIIHGHTHSPSESSYNNGRVNVLGLWQPNGAYIALYKSDQTIQNIYWSPTQ